MLFVASIIISITLAIAIIVFAFFYFYRVVKPVREIIQACQQVKKGILDVTIKVKNKKTEIGKLATAFNEMIKDLKESRAALQEAKAVLEIKVASRTKELEELTATLEERVQERTKEIQERIKELERFHQITIGRELKMIELKKEIKKLQAELKKQKQKE